MTTYAQILEAQKLAHGGDTSALEALMSEDFTWTSVSKSSLASQSRGRSEALEWFGSHEFDYESTNAIFETPSAIVAEEVGSERGIGRMACMIFYRIKDGQLAEMRHVRGDAP